MEDLTLALVTLTSFVLLFVVAIFADRAGADLETSSSEAVPVPVEPMVQARQGAPTMPVLSHPRKADVA